jgi:hypothetical protein
VSIPFLVRAMRRIQALETPDSVDNIGAAH